MVYGEKAMKVLVTGGTTFVSKATAEYFVKEGYETYVLNRNSKPQVAGVHLIEGDRHQLGDKLKGLHFDVILDVTSYDGEDVKSLLDALDCFDQYILVSSSAVYPEYGVQPFKEDSLKALNKYWGKYGTDKIEAETVLLDRVSDAYILRPPYIYGPMDNVYREAFVFDCAKGDRDFYLPKDGSMKLHFLYVYDLCRIMDAIIRNKPREHILNVGNKETITIKKWVELCYKAMGKQANFIEVHEDVEQRSFFPFHNYEYALDINKLNMFFDDYTDMETGLKEAADWYLDHEGELKKKTYLEFIDDNFRSLK